MRRLFLLQLVLLLMVIIPVSATTFKVEASADRLEIGETFANIIPALTSREIPELQSGTITAKGSTKYNQFLRFAGLPYPYVRFTKNTENEVEDFLSFRRNTGANNAFFEYEMEFESGLESDIKDNELEDIIGKQLYIFNQPYVITFAQTSGNTVELQMVSGGTSDFIEKGQTKQLNLNNRIYTIKVVSVDANTKKVKLEVNGEVLPDMNKGDIRLLPDQNFIGITKILTSTSTTTTDIVEIFVGARAVKLKDNNYNDQNFGEEVEINTIKKPNAYTNIIATLTGTTLKISKIKYRLASIEGQDVKKGTFLSEYLGQQADSLLGNWDIRYNGFQAITTNPILFTPIATDDEYKISFKNKNGESFVNIPFISNRGSFKLGDATNDLIIEEGVNIDANDYFTITDRNDKTGITYILRYNSIDTNANTFKVFDYASNTEKTINYQNSSISGQIGTAEIAIGTLKANATIRSDAGNPLRVDLNTNGTFDSNVVNIVTSDGGILVLQSLSGSTYTINLRTEGSQFEENTTNENIQFVFETRGGNTIGIQSSFPGITTSTSGSNIVGLSNYGVSMKYTDLGGTEAETLLFDYPRSQRFAEAYIEVYQAPLQQAIANTTVLPVQTSTCSNGIQDGDETGMDCGGSCSPCAQLASCSDGIQNQGETEIDCGGPCQPCAVQSLCPQGCVYIGSDGLEICMKIGETTETLYCSKDGNMKLKKSNGIECREGYECKVGMCEQNVCGKEMTPTLLILNITALMIFFGALGYMIRTLVKH